MIKYESSIKNMGRKITDRDNARVDYDRARSKADKSNGDPVLEATARASEQVYLEKNFAATESLEYFLDTRLENLSAIMSFFAQATAKLYTSCASLPQVEVVVAPAPELALAAGVSMSAPAKSPRLQSLSSEPRLDRGSAAAALPSQSQQQQQRSPRVSAVSEMGARERSNSAGAGSVKPSPFAVKKAGGSTSVVPEKPPAKVRASDEG